MLQICGEKVYYIENWASLYKLITSHEQLLISHEFLKTAISPIYCGVITEKPRNGTSCVLPSQLTFTCSTSTIEILQKDMKYIQS